MAQWKSFGNRNISLIFIGSPLDFLTQKLSSHNCFVYKLPVYQVRKQFYKSNYITLVSYDELLI